VDAPPLFVPRQSTLAPHGLDAVLDEVATRGGIPSSVQDPIVPMTLLAREHCLRRHGSLRKLELILL